MAASAVSLKKHYSVEEYLQLEQQEDIRYEYHDGDVLAMAGGSMNHSDIAYNINNYLKEESFEKGCRSFQESIKLQSVRSNSYLYPDVVLTCNADDIEDGYIINNPIIVVEVLSPSTESYDRGTKSILYRRIPSLRYYLLVSQTEVLVEMYSRNSATALFQIQDFSDLDDVIQLPEIHLSLSLQQIYRRIKLTDKKEL